MVDDVFSCFYFGLYQRISTVILVSSCILCSYPQICMAKDEAEYEKFGSDIVANISDGNANLLLDGFDELEKSMKSSIDPFNMSFQFLQAFIGEINTRYGLHLTIYEACVLIRENLDSLKFSEEVENVILDMISLFESDYNRNFESVQNKEGTSRSSAVDLNVNWLGYWLGSDKKHHKNRQRHSSSIAFSSPLLQVIETDNELPGALCAGGAEVLAGALLCILGPMFPPAYGIGVGLVVDGMSRVVTGLDEMDKQRSNLSSQSSGPFKVDF